MINSKQKGSRYERELASILKEYGYDARRTAQYCGKTGDAADVIGLDGIHIEAKHQERINIYDWMAQAVRDSAGTGNIPTVFFRKNHCDTLVCMRLEDFITLYREYRGRKMAKFRAIQMAFWTDSKVAEQFTPDEKFIFLYLLTTPLTNLCGCYELSNRQIAFDTGVTAEKAGKVLKELKKHGVIDYSQKTNELLIINWHKYNWTTSQLFRKPLKAEIDAVKDEGFKNYLLSLYEGQIAEYRIDTVSEIEDTVSEEKKVKEPKKKYGKLNHVLLTEREYNTLCEKYGAPETTQAIDFLDLYIEDKGYKSKSHYTALIRWVFDAVRERAQKQRRTQTQTATTNINDYLMAQATGGMYEQAGNI